MICNPCGNGKHKACKKRNKNKQGADCDCQHRIGAAKIRNGTLAK